MSAPFVASLRVRPETIRLGPGAQNAATVRVEMPEVWDAVRIDTSLDQPVIALKRRALEALYPGFEFHEDFILKLKGFEVLDEEATLAETGAVNGSIYLLTHRRRRPVR